MNKFICIIIVLLTCSVVNPHTAHSQSFAMGGGTTIRQQLHFFNVEGGVWNVAKSRWNVHAGLKARLIALKNKSAGESESTEARYTPYARVGYTVIPRTQRVFGELSISAEQSPELGFAVYFRVIRNGQLNFALMPRITLGKNDYTLGSYCMMVMGI